MNRLPPQINLWTDLGLMLAEVATSGARKMQKRLKPRRRGSYRTRRPGEDTPMWNACVVLLKEELKPYGSKVRLARYLGIPKQRITDFLKNGSRMPEAETLLQILNWLAQKRSGTDLSL